MQNFNTSNPEYLTFKHEQLLFSIMGGIRLDGLDRMRVTLKIEFKDQALRHNLDLYNDTQTDKLIRKTAERLSIGVSYVTKAVMELVNELESYRLESIEAQQSRQEQLYVMSEAEKKEATDFLDAPGLMERTNLLIGQAGVIGEEMNRLTMYVIFLTRKLKTPLHVVSLGASGMGKTHLQEKIAEFVPEQDRIEITTLSENAFYYFDRSELAQKLILIEDLDGAENSLYALRELQSKKRISKTIAQKNARGETKTIHLVVEGPVSVAGCTTKESIYEDNANRSFLLYLDESSEQDQLIMNYQRQASSGKIDTFKQEQIKQLLQNTQRLLEPFKVVNPYAEHLQLPRDVFKPRRTNSHYLQFIEAVTFYHQRQRAEQVDQATGEVFIETTLEDIEEANKLLKDVLLRKSDQLTGACRGYFEKLKFYLLGSDQRTFTNGSMSRIFRIPITTIKRYHYDLSASGYLKISKEKGSKANLYEVISYEEYKELQNRIYTSLDESLQILKKNLKQPPKPKSPKQPSKQSGLIKTSTVKA